MSYTEVIYAIGDAVTASFELLRMLGSGLPYGGVMNWALITVGVLLMINWMRQMTTHEEQYEENRPK